jgi:hypothetical protein
MNTFIQNSISSVVNRTNGFRAQNTYEICPNGQCPLIGDDTLSNLDQEAVAQFIIAFASFFSYIAVAVAVLFLVISGLQLVTDTGDGKRAESAKKNFMTTIIGLVLVIVAFTIVQVLSNFLAGDVLGDFF